MTPEETTILLAALNERYESLRAIRGRVQEITIWTVGILLGGAGWIIATEHLLSAGAKLAFIAGIVVALFVVVWLYLRDLEKGFRGQQKVASKIEGALGLFTPGKYNCADAIYPGAWANSGSNGGDGNYFASNFSMILWAAGFLAVVILAKGVWF